MGPPVSATPDSKVPVRRWNPWELYDVSQKEIRIMNERARYRASMKAEYERRMGHIGNALLEKPGVIHDPGVVRFNSMRQTTLEYFRKTPRTGAYFLLAYLIPGAFFAKIVTLERRKKEEDRTTRRIKDKDVYFKFMY